MTVKWDELQIGERLGAGAFGEVHCATLRGELVAVKKLILPQDESGLFVVALNSKSMQTDDLCFLRRRAERKKAMAAFERECATMRALPAHRNVLAVVGMCDDPPALITEFCAGLFRFLLCCFEIDL